MFCIEESTCDTVGTLWRHPVIRYPGHVPPLPLLVRPLLSGVVLNVENAANSPLVFRICFLFLGSLPTFVNPLTEQLIFRLWVRTKTLDAGQRQPVMS